MGWDIKGYQVTKTDNSPTAESTVKKVSTSTEKVIADFTILYERDLYNAIGDDGKVWGMANACNNCRVSLVQCHCGNPTIFGNIPVTIKMR